MLRVLFISCTLLFGCVQSIFAQDVSDTKLLKTLLDKKKDTTAKADSTGSSPTTSDSLQQKVTRMRHSLDSTKAGLQNKINNLHQLKLPADKYQHQLDSLSKVDPIAEVKKQEARLLTAQQKVTSSVTKTEQKLTQKLNSLTDNHAPALPSANIPGANLPETPLGNVNSSAVDGALPGKSLPNVALPNASIPGTPNLTGDFSKETSAITGAPAKELGELKNIGEVKSVTNELGEAGKVTAKAGEYTKEISGVAKGDKESIDKVSGKLEKEALSNGELKNLGAENQQLAELKKLQSEASSPEAMEKKAIEEAKKQAVNHFAGKEAVLQGAMDKVSKLKQKYSSITSLNNIPKRIPNEMKGKPFIERILPGISYQVLRTDHRYRIDVNPWLGYRLTGHITIGAGWNERVSYYHSNFSTAQHVYGPRAFGEYRLKGLWLRAEFEFMNTLVPPNQTVMDQHYRTWVANSFVGIKKRYRIYKNFYGTTSILYNVNTLYQHHHVNIYGDPLVGRIGFEIPIKKKVKNSARVN